MTLTIEQAELFEKRFNEIRPDYSIQFGLWAGGEGFEICEFDVDENGRVTMKINELYLNRQYALRYRYHTRHPKLTEREIEYLLGKVDTVKDKYYVMYWNDREDYPVAVFEIMAGDQGEAEEIAHENGGDAYEDEWPLLTETDEWMTENKKKRYKNSVYTDYYDLTKKGGR